MKHQYSDSISPLKYNTRPPFNITPFIVKRHAARVMLCIRMLLNSHRPESRCKRGGNGSSVSQVLSASANHLPGREAKCSPGWLTAEHRLYSVRPVWDGKKRLKPALVLFVERGIGRSRASDPGRPIARQIIAVSQTYLSRARQQLAAPG